ncbi:unnamed protein product [Ophioblennius macclurei]
MESEESDWTNENLHRLFTAMRTIIPEQETTQDYGVTLKTLDWSKVAFLRFSPEDCQKKWSETLNKMRKIRSLTELLDEAEDILSDTANNQKLHPQVLQRPNCATSIYFGENHAKLRKQHPKLESIMLFKLAINQFEKLPDKKKAYYLNKSHLQNEDYQSKLHQFRNNTYQKEKCYAATRKDENERVKPPQNGYNLFCREQQLSREGVPAKNLFQEWAQRWKSLSKSEQKEYAQKCKMLKLQYKTNLEKYLKNRRSMKEKHSECESSEFPHHTTKAAHVTPTSDSEDEDLEDSSSEEEQYYVNFNEVEKRKT